MKVNFRVVLLVGCYLFAFLVYIWPYYFWQDELRDLHRLVFAIGWMLCWITVFYRNTRQKRWFWLCFPSLLLVLAPWIAAAAAMLLWTISGFN